MFMEMLGASGAGGGGGNQFQFSANTTATSGGDFASGDINMGGKGGTWSTVALVAVIVLGLVLGLRGK